MRTRSNTLKKAINRYHNVTNKLNKLKEEQKTLRDTLLDAMEGKTSISTDNLIVLVNERINKRLDKDLLIKAFPKLYEYETRTTSKVISVKKI